ncbi:MAG: flagellar basal body P-ring formation protein FlgA [Alphaproteobacteria bacterium]|nr:flagellar basal body P-ring formation protein FlgA [Alphaproteobacteria bacterium SS10]
MIIRRCTKLLVKATIVLTVIGGVLFTSIASDAADLRRQSVVEADYVTLGDLFDGLTADQAEKNVAPAPAPGRRAVFDYRTLGRLARAYRVQWQASSTLDRVVIERVANVIEHAVVERHLVNAIAADSLVEAETISVNLDNRAVSISLPVDVPPTMAVTRLNHDPISGRFTATIVAPATGSPEYEGTVTGRSIDIVAVPVLTEPMRRGDVIAEHQVEMIKIPSERINSDILVGMADLVGMTPRRSISANTPIRASDLREPVLIERGTPVTIRLNKGGIALTAKGRAMDDAAQGQGLRVMNVTSNRMVDAVAITANLVEVNLH